MTIERSLPKYITKDKYGYRLRKVINGKEHQILHSNNYEYIKQCLQECIQAKWDYPKLQEIRTKYNKNKPLLRENQYIYLETNGRYIIRRQGESYNKFKTLSEARKERDYWESIHWDWEMIEW